jgi:uncharacterized protein DUF2382
MFEAPPPDRSAADPGAEETGTPASERPPNVAELRWSGRPLPLEANVESSSRGWTIRLPVRAEYIMVDKRPVVVEEVVVRRRPLEDAARVGDTVRRERLRVETEGDVTERLRVEED